jgi:hypothetical protein
MLVRAALIIRHLPIYAKEAQLSWEIKKTLGRACDAYLPSGYEHKQTIVECMYVEGVGQKSGPCTATFNDLLCFPYY